MTDTERIICRCVSGTEARSAESSLDNCPCCKEVSQDTVSCKFHIDRCTCRVNAECKGVCTDACSAEDVCCCTDILKSAACTSGDDSLLYIKFTVNDFVLERIWNFAVETDLSLFLYIIKDVIEVFFEFIDSIGIAWVEWHCDHRFDLT